MNAEKNNPTTTAVTCECGRLSGKGYVSMIKSNRSLSFGMHYVVQGSFYIGKGRDNGLLICGECNKPALSFGREVK